MERIQVVCWFRKFKNSATSVEDAKCVGCTLTSKTDENWHQVKEHALKSRIVTSMKL
jgi:hypothetical protein